MNRVADRYLESAGTALAASCTTTVPPPPYSPPLSFEPGDRFAALTSLVIILFSSIGLWAVIAALVSYELG